MRRGFRYTGGEYISAGAGKSDLIPRVFEVPQHIGFVGLNQVSQCPVAACVRVPTSHQVDSGGPADWMIGIGVGEFHAPGCQRVDVGRLNKWVAKASNAVSALLIGHDH